MGVNYTPFLKTCEVNLYKVNFLETQKNNGLPYDMKIWVGTHLIIKNIIKIYPVMFALL